MTTEHARPEKRNRVESGATEDVLLDVAAGGGETNASPSPLPATATTTDAAAQTSNLIIQLVSETGETLGPQLDVPSTITQQQLAALVNDLKGTPLGTADALPYAFFVDGELQLLPSTTALDDVDAAGEAAAKSNKKKAAVAPSSSPSSPSSSGGLGALLSAANRSVEGAVEVQFRPQASFRARAVCRCSASLEGHADAVLSVAFAPDGSRLASGSGDTTVRLWSLERQGSPEATLQGAHKGWVLAVSWSPDGELLATAGMDSVVGIWDVGGGALSSLKSPSSSSSSSKERKKEKKSAPSSSSSSPSSSSPLLLGICKGHSKWVTSLAWEPAHLSRAAGEGEAGGTAGENKSKSNKSKSASSPLSSRLATGSKDGTVRVWDARKGRKCLATMSGHRLAVTSVVWGGGGGGGGGGIGSGSENDVDGDGEIDGRIFSASRDGTVNVWCPRRFTLVASLKGHGHWVNALALSTGHALRTGAFDHEGKVVVAVGDGGGSDGDDTPTAPAARAAALARYRAARGALPPSSSPSSSSSSIAPQMRPEVLASASDDFTVILWHPQTSTKPFARLTGHSAPVTAVAFSPDGRRLATASFDKSVRLWCGLSGKYLATLRGHVGPVYALAWAPDSRLLLSGSKDSTLKVWDVAAATPDGKCRIAVDLPGHADEVFAVDWAPAGGGAASGSKDKLVRLWRH